MSVKVVEKTPEGEREDKGPNLHQVQLNSVQLPRTVRVEERCWDFREAAQVRRSETDARRLVSPRNADQDRQSVPSQGERSRTEATEVRCPLELRTWPVWIQAEERRAWTDATHGQTFHPRWKAQSVCSSPFPLGWPGPCVCGGLGLERPRVWVSNPRSLQKWMTRHPSKLSTSSPPLARSSSSFSGLAGQRPQLCWTFASASWVLDEGSRPRRRRPRRRVSHRPRPRCYRSTSTTNLATLQRVSTVIHQEGPQKHRPLGLPTKP